MPISKETLDDIVYLRLPWQLGLRLRRLARESQTTLSGFIRNTLTLAYGGQEKPEADPGERFCC
jgi:hypothetical protein